MVGHSPFTAETRVQVSHSLLIGGIIMGKVKVTCEINTYNEPSKPSIRIHSHWNRSRWVEIEVNGERIVVDGEELKTAVDNCMNVLS